MSYILTRGKYKGTDVADVQDTGYLRWCLNNWDLGPLERKAMEDAINPSRELNKPMVGQTYITQEQVKKAADFLIQRVSVMDTTPDLPEKVIREMYRMLTGKDYVN